MPKYKIPITIKAKGVGIKPAANSIGKAPGKFRTLSREAVKKGAKAFQKKQRRNAPVGKRGTIGPSVNIYIRPFRGGWRGVSFTNYNVAFFTEEGTGMRGGWRSERYPVPRDYDGPLNKMFSYRSRKTGEIVWVGRHPGMKGKKWFARGFEAGVPEAERAFTSSVRRSFV